MKKTITIGIIIAIIVVGAIIGYSFGTMLGQSQEPKVADDPSKPQPAGKNITINLNEGLNLNASP